MAYLTQSQLDQFHRDGYLIVKQLFDPQADLDPIVQEYHGVLEQTSRLNFMPKARSNRPTPICPLASA